MSRNTLFSTIFKVVLGLTAILLIWVMVASVNNSIKNALNPIAQTNRQISTQVSQLLHPTPTVIPDPVTIIHEVRALAKLETIQYTVEKVIKAEVNQGVLGPLFGDQLLFVAHGTVIAGIDMEMMGSSDMWIQDGVLNVRLPPAEILVATLDNDKSYVYDRRTGVFTHGDPDLETAARQVAVDEIRKAAEDDGILDLAQQNAETFLNRFFQALGYPEVIFVQPTPQSP